MKFKMPDGFEMPPDIPSGEEFKVVATLKDNEDGTFTLIEVDGSKLKDGEEEEEETEEVIPAKRESMMDRATARGLAPTQY